MGGVASRIEGNESPPQDQPGVLECPHSVLEAIRAAVLDSFNSTPHGGAEVYGVLFGSYPDNNVRIEAFRTVAFESLCADSKALSEQDGAAFAAAVAAPRGDDDVNLEPVGWFRSHPRSEVTLSARDLEIANTFFPDPRQVTMIMRPGDAGPTLVRFLFREAGGVLTAASPFREFTVPQVLDPLPPPADVEPPREVRAPQGARLALEAPAPETPMQLEKAPQQPAPVLALVEEPVVKWRLSLNWPLALAMAAGLVITLYWMMPARQRLALRVVDDAGQLRITWDPVWKSGSGRLEINDGGAKVWIELNPDQLRNGSMTYSRRSNDVSVRLAVERPGAQPLQEVTRFLGTTDTRAAREEPPRETATALAELVVPVPVEQVAAPPPRPRPFAAPAPVAFQPPVANKLPPEPLLTPVVAGDVPSSVLPTPVHADAPAAVPRPPSTPEAAGAAPGVSTGAAQSPAQSPPQSPASAARPRGPAAPVSGRIIWTGRWPKNQVVTITGKFCSSGTIMGELPAKPVKFSVSPGDLSSDGMVLYTSNLQYANSVIEPPGAQNGWNKTVYTWNPKHAGDITVEESPGPQNQWNRLVLRSKNPKISVIVIDWALVN